MAHNQVFISYAWGGESETVANELETILQSKGIDLVRDKSDLGFKGLIREFMQEIGRGNLVVLVISDKYLKSKNCMFELMEVERKGEFFDRIFPVILPDANIYDSLGILGYLKYWDQKIKELNASAKELDNLADTRKVQEDINLYTDIRGAIDDLAGKLSNMNTLTLEFMRSKSYQPLIEALLTKKENHPLVSPGPSAKKEGKVLYHIPDMMRIQRWTRCTVRLAWEELLLKEGLTIPESEQTIESIRMGNIMQVALGEGPDRGKFEIHALSSEEQFIEEGEFTEWLFDVKPLELGRFSLVLKISLIQVIEGKERKKDLVLERVVITETEAPQALPRFETAESGLRIQERIPQAGFGNQDFSKASPPIPDAVPSKGMVPPAPLPSAGAKTLTIRKLMPYAASVLVLVTAGILIFGGGLMTSSPDYSETVFPSTQGTDSYTEEEELPTIVGSASPGEKKLLLSFSKETPEGTAEVMAFVISASDYWQLQDFDFPMEARVVTLPDSLADRMNLEPTLSPNRILDSVLRHSAKETEISSHSSELSVRIPARPLAFDSTSEKTLRRIRVAPSRQFD